jgi:hypothetical protein
MDMRDGLFFRGVSKNSSLFCGHCITSLEHRARTYRGSNKGPDTYPQMQSRIEEAAVDGHPVHALCTYDEPDDDVLSGSFLRSPSPD